MARHTAFDILYKEYYPRVFGLCRRLLNSAELAEDATQETFMRAYRKFGKFDADRGFWQWIAAIANNHCIDLLRTRNRNRFLFGDEEAELLALENAVSADVPVLSELIALEDADALSSAVATLEDKYRVPLVLAYFEYTSYDGIAEQLGVTRNHVGVLLLRARHRLRAILGPQSQQHQSQQIQTNTGNAQ